MKQKKKKKLTTVQKDYPIDGFIMFPLSIFTSILVNYYFQSERFTLHRKSFLKDLLRQGKDQNKRGKV